MSWDPRAKQQRPDAQAAHAPGRATLVAAESDEADDADRRWQQLEGALREIKRSELRLLIEAETTLRFHPRAIEEELAPIVGPQGPCKLEAVWEAQVALIVRLRAAYQAAGVPDGSWKVSVDVHDEARFLDIDFDRGLNLLWAYYEPRGYAPDYHTREARWRGAYGSY